MNAEKRIFFSSKQPFCWIFPLAKKERRALKERSPFPGEDQANLAMT